MSASEPYSPGADPSAPTQSDPRVAVIGEEIRRSSRRSEDELLAEMAAPARPAGRIPVEARVPSGPVAEVGPAADFPLGEDQVEEVPTGWRGRPKGRLKARRVRRVVRYVSPWSVFKVSVLFAVCLWLILMVAGVILWQAAVSSGMVTNLEKFLAKLLAEESFAIDGRELFRATAITGVILVFAGSAFAVLMSLLFNVISDITGGIRITVLELEDTVREVKMPFGRAERTAGRTPGEANSDGSWTN